MPNCFGAGADQCFECVGVRRGGVCTDSCALTEYEDATTHECLSCHEQCQDACTGPGANECLACRNWQEDTSCVRVCTIATHFADPANLQCIGCDQGCDTTTPLPSCPLGVCAKCLHKRSGDSCVQTCAADEYVDTSDLRRAVEGTLRMSAAVERISGVLLYGICVG